MMKPKEIQELLDFIASSGLAEVNIETEQFKINVKRNSVASAPLPIALSSLPQAIGTSTQATSTSSADKPVETPAEKSNQITIKSPMIGTFYRSSGPDTPSFVNVGDEIAPGKVMCIIEAMKLFNEIESEFSGKIVKILVDNATPVEFDQPLFIIEQL